MLFKKLQLEAEFNLMLETLKKANAKTILATSIFIVAIMPSLPFAHIVIQSSMAFHMLIQIPMLILAGYVLKKISSTIDHSLAESLAQWLWIYLSGLFWMLPISLDKALIYPIWDIFKVITLLITGAILKVVFQSHRVLALFFIGSTAMMLFFVGFYYQGTNVRLCNAYLIESQHEAGSGLIMAASLLLGFLFWKIQQGLVTADSIK